jgi:hypothetical protein
MAAQVICVIDFYLLQHTKGVPCAASVLPLLHSFFMQSLLLITSVCMAQFSILLNQLIATQNSKNSGVRTVRKLNTDLNQIFSEVST